MRSARYRSSEISCFRVLVCQRAYPLSGILLQEVLFLKGL